jgi:putative membrane protein
VAHAQYDTGTMTAALASALHVVAIAIALTAMVLRDRGLSAPRFDDDARDTTLRGDNWSGVAAILLVGTGLWRLLGGLEKPTDWYLRDPGFHLKMTIFGVAWLVEALPMITFIRWRMQMKAGAPLDLRRLRALRRLNRIQLGVFTALIGAAALMAHGVLHPTTSIDDDPACAVEDRIVTRCLTCHTSAGPQGQLVLEGDWRAALVDTPSAQWPTERRVVAGEPERSLLWRKLTGTQAPHGAAMPLGQTGDPDLAAAVEAWIRAGAPACER